MRQLQVTVVGDLRPDTALLLGDLYAGAVPLPAATVPLPVVFSTADVLLADLGAVGRLELTALLTRLLGHSGAPFVVCGVGGSPGGRAELLHAGASDALSREMPAAEVRARLLARSRRCSPHLCQHGNLRVNTLDRRAAVGEQEVQFTRSEFELLTRMVMSESGLVLEEVGVREARTGLIDHMMSIRTKLRAADCTVLPRCLRGVGYRLTPILEEGAR